MKLSLPVVAVAVAIVLAVSGCTSGGEDASATEERDQDVAAASEQPTPRIVQPGAPGEPNRVLTPSEAAALTSPPEHTEADVRFMQGMIAHHAQALEMTALIADRTSRDGLPVFAERMDISQTDEIEQMKRWLEERGEEVPDLDEGHEHGDHSDHGGVSGERMPGMLTEEEMAQLEAASGEEFDRLFLQYMIRHHEGALTMVAELFEQNGGQEPEAYRLASHIDSDQRIEIARMQQMLAEIEGE